MKQFEPLIEEDFFVLVAPDGNIQITTIAPDEATCMAVIKMLHKAGWGQSFHEMKMKGFAIEKVKVTIKK